jgi:hypothetical protein
MCGTPYSVRVIVALGFPPLAARADAGVTAMSAASVMRRRRRRFIEYATLAVG